MRNSIFHKIQDFIKILRGTWFLQLLNVLALFVFLVIAQGEDVLLLIAEHTGTFHLFQLAALLTAVFFWSVSSEFGTRMLIYLTDNSGRSLDPARVDNRKKYQLWISRMALFFPVALMILAFIKVYTFNHHQMVLSHDSKMLPNIGIGVFTILSFLLLEGVLLWWLYPRNVIVRLSRKYRWLKWMAISARENQWVTKLYGILNDVRVDIPASDAGYTGNDLPRNVILPDGMKLPESDDFTPAADNPITPEGSVRVWMFHIRPRFYRCLLRQMLALLVVAALLIVVIGLWLPVGGAMSLGSAAIFCFAFGAWAAVYVCLHFLDKAQPVPVRFLLLVWIIICSVINNDHPVRRLPGLRGESVSLQVHFDQWLKNARKDEERPYWYRIGNDTTIPVIFVSAEGGALRTGAFTGLLLARLELKFPLFKNYLFAYSSVSGGTVGSNFFNAQLIRNRDSSGTTQTWYVPSVSFFGTDFLSAPVAKLAFGEILNYCWPVHWDCADRAIALEKSFEYGWQNAYGEKDNLLAGSFNRTLDNKLPAVFINTTEAETGLQNVWSNVSLKGIPLEYYRDLREIQDANLSYSAAINLSDRFPLVSPGGAFFRLTKDKENQDSIYSRHFVDGGYYENKGSETLLQVLKALHLEGKAVKPYILQFNFSPDTAIKSITKGNELMEIVGGVYNTRSGRGRIAQDALTEYVKALHGVFIPLNLNIDEKNLPMNWVMSQSVVDKLDNTVRDLANLKDKPLGMDTSAHRQLKQLFLYDKRNIRRKKD